MSSTDKKIWFVTGSSSGLGRAVVEHALEKGDKVVATLRTPSALSDLQAKYSKDQLLVEKLDVTSPADIISAFENAISTFGRIDIVYNNAGYTTVGEIEGTPDELARDIFNVNFWGSTNVARETIHIFRDVNKPRGGRLLQVSSIFGVQAFPGMGFYSATKFAMEGISQALADELHPSWNIKITLLEPGGFRTRALNSEVKDGVYAAPVHPAYAGFNDYGASACRNLVSQEKNQEGLGDPLKAAREIYKIAMDDTVGLRVPLGLDALASMDKYLDNLIADVKVAKKFSEDLK